MLLGLARKNKYISMEQNLSARVVLTSWYILFLNEKL